MRSIKPRHVLATLVLMAQAPILAPWVAGWLISGLVYVAVLVLERARGRMRDRGARQRHAPRGRLADAAAAADRTARGEPIAGSAA